MSIHVKEILKFKRSFLKRLKEEVDGDHSGWERFVTRHPSARAKVTYTLCVKMSLARSSMSKLRTAT
jgi:hypothetical protein